MSPRKEEKIILIISSVKCGDWYKFTCFIVAACREECSSLQGEPRRLSKKWNGLGWGLMEEEDLPDWGAGKDI